MWDSATARIKYIQRLLRGKLCISFDPVAQLVSRGRADQLRERFITHQYLTYSFIDMTKVYARLLPRNYIWCNMMMPSRLEIQHSSVQNPGIERRQGLSCPIFSELACVQVLLTFIVDSGPPQLVGVWTGTMNCLRRTGEPINSTSFFRIALCMYSEPMALDEVLIVSCITLVTLARYWVCLL